MNTVIVTTDKIVESLRGRERFNSKTLFYKDCSFGSVKSILPKLLYLQI